MMNRITVTIIFTLLCFVSSSQNISKREKLERIKAQKIAFISNKLELTSAEAQQFWPVYNDFFKEKEKLNNEKTSVNKELLLNWQEYSDAKKTVLVDRLIEFRLTEAKIEQKYHEKLKTVLPIDKVIKLYNAETQFKNFLLKQIKGQGNREIRSQDRESRRR
ncbi:MULTISPECIES: hypothetical protein [unclassified Saccharicrinis]|uniref:hypothetical protein n=1 Tax=unclassified Saccharicrinis TaxID=2646859 RepID=UPI003D3476F3